MTVRQWILQAEERLKGFAIQAPALEAQMLAAHVVGSDRAWLFAHPDAPFDAEPGDLLLERRASGEPLAYILGWREFYGREFGVDASVLIPRHETETLIEAVLNRFPAQVSPVDSSELSVLDIGTGSGIIAIILKLERPNWTVTAVDVSADALATASANAKMHQAPVRFILSDAFQSLLGESFDLIVSNPPYIGREESLPIEVALFEPEIALYAENEGMAFYEQLSLEAQNYLHDMGVLLVEVGYQQAGRVIQLFQSRNWTVVEQSKDLSGTLRVLGFRHEFDCSEV